MRMTLAVAGWLVGWLLFFRLPLLRGRASDEDPTAPADPASLRGDVAVVAPARNEEANLPAMLASLDRQTAPAGRVIVVDDRSTDATAAVAWRHPGVTVIDGAPLPAGWTGKSWACAQGVAAAGDAPTLVFLDADVALAPGALEAITGMLRASGGLVSVQPYHRMRRPYERLSALFNVVAVMGVGMARFGLARFGMARLGAAWRGRRPSTRGAFGPVLACTRADYDLVGGHRAVRRSVVEDVALAERFHAAGLPVTVVGGGPLVSFRMYPHGLRQLVEGWTKNIATGAAHAGLWRTALVVGWVCSLILSIQLALDPLASGGSWGPAAVAYAAFAGQLAVQLRQLGNFGWVAAAAYPVLVVFFVAVFARSLWFLGVRRRVAWRGRTIELAGRYGRAAGEMALAPTPSSAGEAGAEDR